MKGLDYSTLRDSLLNYGLQETTDPTTKPFLLWMEQLENNKFDDRYYKTQCFIMNILSDEKTIITDKSNLYINFNKKYPEACEKYMAQTWALDDFLKDEVLSKNKNKKRTYKIEQQVVNYQSKVIGIIATSTIIDTNVKQTGYIPCYPSSINSKYEYAYINENNL